MDEFYEPEDVRDIYIDGIAKTELTSGGLVRFYLYAVEGMNHPIKVIRARLLLGFDSALDTNAEAKAKLTTLRRQMDGLRLVGKLAVSAAFLGGY